MEDTREVLSTFSTGQRTSMKTDISTRACVGLDWVSTQTSTRSTCCCATCCRRPEFSDLGTEQDFREGAASLIHHVIKGPDDQNGYGRSWLPGFFIEEDMLLSALSHICVCEKSGASFKEFVWSDIFISGGFGADFTQNSLWATFRLDMLHFPTTNGEHSTGDAIKVGEGMGAITIDLESVQVHPTGLVKPDDHYAKIEFVAAEALRGVGGLLV